ncbi:plastidic glucose transporter 4-like [Humulus lupulus]|uniref:plastidic glucose transporter 4-like n=1 Tax=Humulus lupulus TaxID=3486 RepID=UPI002B40E0F3|nr:plastidic glucose transporter 4-like [Humulus lupulus]
MDRQGRKSLLITSFGGMAASMMLLSLSFTWKVLAPYSGPLAVLGTVLYVLSFSLGVGPVPALLLPEIFASRIRAKAVALSLGMHWHCLSSYKSNEVKEIFLHLYLVYF